MRVLHVYRTWYPDQPGGLPEAIRQFALATRPFGVESRVFALSPDPVPARIDRADATVVRARSWAAPASCDLGGPGAFAEFRRQVRWADVVQYHFPWPFADLLHVCAGARRPSIMTWHSDIVRQRLLSMPYWPLARRTLAAMDAIVTTSPAYAGGSAWLSRLRDRSRLRMIPLGIVEESCAEALAASAGIDVFERFGGDGPAAPDSPDSSGRTPTAPSVGARVDGAQTRSRRAPDPGTSDLRAQGARPPDPGSTDAPARADAIDRPFGARDFFLAIGVLRYYKGFDVLIDAAARARLPVWIAGDGPLRAELRAKIRASGAPVRLLGHVSEAEKMALLRDCRALVLPSPLRSEAFGMVLVEASLMGRPMISCEIGTGTSFVNRHDETGLVVAPGDADALAGALRALAGDPTACARFGAAARARYEACFAGPRLGDAWARLYEEVRAARAAAAS